MLMPARVGVVGVGVRARLGGLADMRHLDALADVDVAGRVGDDVLVAALVAVVTPRLVRRIAARHDDRGGAACERVRPERVHVVRVRVGAQVACSRSVRAGASEVVAVAAVVASLVGRRQTGAVKYLLQQRPQRGDACGYHADARFDGRPDGNVGRFVCGERKEWRSG